MVSSAQLKSLGLDSGCNGTVYVCEDEHAGGRGWLQGSPDVSQEASSPCPVGSQHRLSAGAFLHSMPNL